MTAGASSATSFFRRMSPVVLLAVSGGCLFYPVASQYFGVAGLGWACVSLAYTCWCGLKTYQEKSRTGFPKLNFSLSFEPRKED